MPSPEEQIEILKTVGIALNPGVTIDDLLADGSREAYEADPFYQLLCDMSDAGLSQNIFHLDIECIEGQGSYAALARAMRDLSDGLLPLENVRDTIPSDFSSGGNVTLSFDLKGNSYTWDLKLHNDWVDETLFKRFVKLLAQQSAARRFVMFLPGQDGLIACMTPQQMNDMNAKTGLEFDWIEKLL